MVSKGGVQDRSPVLFRCRRKEGVRPMRGSCEFHGARQPHKLRWTSLPLREYIFPAESGSSDIEQKEVGDKKNSCNDEKVAGRAERHEIEFIGYVKPRKGKN